MNTIKARTAATCLGIGLLLFASVSYHQLRAMIHYPAAVHWNVPTFLHVVLFSLLSAALAGRGQQARWMIPLFWTLVNLVTEALQAIPFAPFRGQFDPLDMAAAIVGGGVAWIILPLAAVRPFRGASFASVMVFGLATISATQCDKEVAVPRAAAMPVYMSYEELRSAPIVGAPETIHRVDKILVDGSWLFLVTRSEFKDDRGGIHVIDNHNPAAPAAVAFLAIPGNVDIAYREGFLYADSFIDMLVIDLRDASEIKVSKRLENVLPYDPYQGVGGAPWFAPGSIDKTKGVVIDWTEQT